MGMKTLFPSNAASNQNESGGKSNHTEYARIIKHSARVKAKHMTYKASHITYSGPYFLGSYTDV